jgi:hypothetical protein
MGRRQQVEQELVTTYNNEPLARLAAQQLQGAHIDCVVQPIGAGPGGWGLAVDIPYALFVHPADKKRTRMLLNLPSHEVSEQNMQVSRTRPIFILIIVAVTATIIFADRLFGHLFGS